jgi:Fe-S cluster biogenesis protein NfuA/nitrite reductase/ring-hydroxylating ferredoxin subunit
MATERSGAMLQDQELQNRIGRIEGLVDAIDTWPDPSAREAATELLQATLDLHGAGLERILDLAWESGEPGQALIDQLAQDPLVGHLLLLHGLHPLTLETRVTQALDKVRPYLGSHGGNVELLGVDDGVVRLRLQGSCNGCASSAVTLKLAIEEALNEVAPDIAELVVEGVVEPRPAPVSAFVPIGQVGAPRRRPAAPAGRWERVTDLADLSAEAVRVRDVAGVAVCFCRVAGQLYAYGAACPACGRPLDGARLAGSALTCARCGGSYDVLRAGRGQDRPDLHLEPIPLLTEHGHVQVALPALAP